MHTLGHFPGCGRVRILASVSRLYVVPETVTAHAARLQEIPQELEHFRGPLRGHATAAAGTRAAVGVESFVGHMSDVLPGFAEASTRLQLAMIAASAGYARADRAVEDSAR
jgi:hypothetical protein